MQLFFALKIVSLSAMLSKQTWESFLGRDPPFENRLWSRPYGYGFGGPPSPTSLTCGSWSVAVRMTQHGLGFRGGNINTAFSFRLFSLFFTLFPSNSSKPPTFSCWLTSPCLPEKASACQELGVCDGLKKAAVLTAHWASLPQPPRHTERRPPAVFLCQAATNSSSSPSL